MNEPDPTLAADLLKAADLLDHFTQVPSDRDLATRLRSYAPPERAQISEDECRDAFEAWFTENDSRTTKERAIERNALGLYRLISAETGWGTWLACAKHYGIVK